MSGGKKRGALEMAGLGHRITHSRRLADPRQLTVLAVKLGTEELCRRNHQGALVSAMVGTALSKAVAQVVEDEGGESPKCPSPCGDIPQGSPDTFLGKDQRQVAVVDQFDVSCRKHSDKPIRQGSADVWVNAVPVARRTDETRCGAHVGEGEPTVLVGAQSQTCSSLDMGAVDAALHQALDLAIGSGKGSGEGGLESALSLGANMAGRAAREVQQVAAKAKKVVGAALSSDIGKCLGKGDFHGAFDAVMGSLGF
jgi:uncharacterized Zn-binding protein involved in type VI secretion